MPSYQIQLRTAAQDSLESLRDDIKTDVINFIESIAQTQEVTQHQGVRNLKGTDYFRGRVGDIRVIAELDKPHLLIHKIGHRNKVYRDLDDL